MKIKKAEADCVFCCFSPPIMVATFAIEIGLAVYTLYKYHRGTFGKIAAALLVLLAAFQLSEYQICSNQAPHVWSRLGLVAITLLPILGLYLVSRIIQNRYFLKFGYAIAAIFAVLFVVIPKGTINPICGGNYVIFSGPEEIYRFYGAYYFGFLILAIWESLMARKKNKNETVRYILKLIIIGYLSFMLPMAIVYAIYTPARYAVASIMCGFAVIFALVLALQIVPRYYKLPVAKEN